MAKVTSMTAMEIQEMSNYNSQKESFFKTVILRKGIDNKEIWLELSKIQRERELLVIKEKKRKEVKNFFNYHRQQ